jgi:hypothetical protein
MENPMELAAFAPEWLTWIAAGCAGAVALTAVARVLDAMLDLEVS